MRFFILKGSALIMKVNIFLFDDFDILDVSAPSEVFGKLPEHFHLEYYSLKGDLISSLQGIKVWTEFLDSNVSGDILIIPGGKGARRIIRDNEDLCKLLIKIIEHHNFCIMLESGISLIAQTGLLYRRNICDFPMDKNWNHMFTAALYRFPNSKWVADGKFYSASSPIAAIDMCLSILADIVDLSVAERIAYELGYHWDSENEDGIYR